MLTIDDSNLITVTNNVLLLCECNNFRKKKKYKQYAKIGGGGGCQRNILMNGIKGRKTYKEHECMHCIQSTKVVL